jgi:hypothetical protein
MYRCVVLAALAGLVAFSPALAGGEIYGTVYTEGGRELTGPIRWDKNDNFWDDRLNTVKKEVIKKAEKEKGFRMSLFGLKLGPDDSSTRNSLSVNFGHLRSIERLEGVTEMARLTLKNGDTIEVRADGSDLGRRMRGLIVDDPEQGEVTLGWRDLDRIEFRANPNKESGRDGDRLHGTVETEAGSFTGFVVWDRDESLAGDVLDGYEEGEEREIEFRRIRSIENKGNKSLVTLTDGTSMLLGGTNDVDDDNRGISVAIDTGLVTTDWRGFSKVTFGETPASPGYDGFDGGKRLRGTVHRRSGAPVSGLIVWDMDEKYSWETLDGDADRLDYAVSFGAIKSVKRQGSRFCEVALRNGSSLTLTGSNDVDEDNRGLIVTGDDGTPTEIDWSTVVSIEFE